MIEVTVISYKYKKADSDMLPDVYPADARPRAIVVSRVGDDPKKLRDSFLAALPEEADKRTVRVLSTTHLALGKDELAFIDGLED